MPALTAVESSTLATRREDLLRFAAGSVHREGGFAWLDQSGRAELDRPVEAWITCRMTHVFALAALQADRAAPALLDHGVRALRGRLRDPQFGGWFASVDADGPVLADKRAYEHAFVLLAASSATAAGHEDGAALLEDAIAMFEQRFWREQDGLVVDVWDRSWTDLEDYRGVNANMHTVEALLAVHDVTGERRWLSRAHRIVERVVHGFARDHGWRLPEHFTASWRPRLDYHRDQPAHPFRPYGVTIGHLLEWSRLALHLRAALGSEAPGWLLEDARALFARAVADGWHVDGADGFVYTTDFEAEPVVRDRLHWVVAEGIAAAWTLAEVTDDDDYLRWYGRLWDYADSFLIDQDRGSWHHELDPQNRPADSVWSGKPDVYHAYQAALLPTLGTLTSFAGALRAS
ncbi:AGE family epimerase/isomerase [Segeticoccus rhizosphaerae]|uniref:AGE family epimerase/isomerase n=1 Tax=Segeticoccus rhizosphaerae TaxID=1104777 RepID=UPI001EF1269D|nr:AGE family epimerase/isomerase [Segeticoccus rhizosphaerae]